MAMAEECKRQWLKRKHEMKVFRLKKKGITYRLTSYKNNESKEV